MILLETGLLLWKRLDDYDNNKYPLMSRQSVNLKNQGSDKPLGMEVDTGQKLKAGAV
ncbi:hypothetical protein FHS10_000906 [Mucilaginibacter dorajii]|uniref:Uncharacterized protein n=1 Tax=Mucilaginibacter dorajii TaxID=692994 RepID=A0ABP7Q021_9SPHI|nr:hypothetical protein [Mucilaginibacter dorajii]